MPSPDLFGPRAASPRRVLMRAIDTGSFPDGKDAAVFWCRKCGRRTDWIYATRRDARRGIACFDCNGGAV